MFMKVNEDVKEDTGGRTVADHEGNRYVTGMGDTGIGEHPLDVILPA
jgi:hypothetical protein